MGDIEITTNPVHQEGQSADGRTDFPMIHVSGGAARASCVGRLWLCTGVTASGVTQLRQHCPMIEIVK